jgi:hypothetical protein
MSDEQREEEIARRLRETGIVRAPDTLRPAVMREVRGPARRRARMPWGGLGVAAAAVAAVALIAVGVTQLGGGTGSSGSAGGGSSGAGALRAQAESSAGTDSRAAKSPEGPIVVGRRQARAILKRYLPEGRKPGTVLLPGRDDRLVVRVPAEDLPQIRRALLLARRASAGPTVTVVLRPRR